MQWRISLQQQERESRGSEGGHRGGVETEKEAINKTAIERRVGADKEDRIIIDGRTALGPHTFRTPVFTAHACTALHSALALVSDLSHLLLFIFS